MNSWSCPIRDLARGRGTAAAETQRPRPRPAWYCVFAVLLLAGCNSKAAPENASSAASAPLAPLRLAVIGDPALAKVLEREWQARSDVPLLVRILTSEELASWDKPRFGADVIVLPSRQLGDAAAHDLLTPLTTEVLEEPAFQWRDILAAKRKAEVQWGEQTCAVPLGGSPWLLFYRRDVFEKLGLKPPRTWGEYRGLAEQLSDRQALLTAGCEGIGGGWTGTCEPLAGVDAADLLLARAASYAKHRSQYSALFDYRTLQPLIGGPPFVRALEELISMKRWTPEKTRELTASDCFQRIQAGDCAMAVGILDGSPPATAAEAPPASSVALSVAPLPGSREVYNFRSQAWEERSSDEEWEVPVVGQTGMLGALTRECRQPAVATQFLQWMAGPEMGATLSAASHEGGPFRANHLAQVGPWVGTADSTFQTAYGQAIDNTWNRSNTFVTLRIPRHAQYLSRLATTVGGVWSGEHPAGAALEKLATEWNQLTDSLDREKQRQAYSQSIGLPP